MIDFKFNGFFWESKIHLPHWVDYQEYGRKDNQKPDRTVYLSFSKDNHDTETLSESDILMVNSFLSNEIDLFPNILQGIFDFYPSLQKEYEDCYDEECFLQYMPPISSIDDLKKLICLTHIHLRMTGPTIGYEFECSWDDEHGLGVLVQEGKIKEIGAADISF